MTVWDSDYGDDTLIASATFEIDNCGKLRELEVPIDKDGEDYGHIVFEIEDFLTAEDLEARRDEDAQAAVAIARCEGIKKITFKQKEGVVHGVHDGEGNAPHDIYLTVETDIDDYETPYVLNTQNPVWPSSDQKDMKTSPGSEISMSVWDSDYGTDTLVATAKFTIDDCSEPREIEVPISKDGKDYGSIVFEVEWFRTA